MKYFNTSDLLQMQQSDTLKFLYTKYYYIHSFSTTPFSCVSCPPYIPDLFDVSDYEYLRLENQRVTFIDSSKSCQITLFSKWELDLMIKFGIVPTSGTNDKGVLDSDWPVFELYTDIQASVQDYKVRFFNWLTTNRDEYLQRLGQTNLTVLYVEDFVSYSAQRLDYVIQNQANYLIISNQLK
jgi:hypothetical protein